MDYERQLHSGSSRALCHAEERVRAHVQSVSVCPFWKPGTTEKVQLTFEATIREHQMENNMETELQTTMPYQVLIARSSSCRIYSF